MGYIPILLVPLAFAMWALAVFLAVKLFAICADKLYSITTGKTLSTESIDQWVVVACLTITLIAPVGGCQYVKVKSYESGVPQALQINDLIFYSEEGLRESCGVAVFELSRITVSRINSQGIAFFKNATFGRGDRPYHFYETWQPTPPLNSANRPLLRGSVCLRDPPQIWSSIEEAARTRGAFYAIGSEYDLLVIPTLGVVVFSFNG